jgi:3-methyladenine DNA glycosylase Tag
VAKPIRRKNENGEIYDLVKYMIKNEWLFFPATVAKDFMDAMSRIYDLEGLNPPKIYKPEETMPEYADDF